MVSTTIKKQSVWAFVYLCITFCPALYKTGRVEAKRMGNQVVGKEVARRVEGAIKVNLLIVPPSPSTSSLSSLSLALCLSLIHISEPTRPY